MRTLFFAFALMLFALPSSASDCTPIPGADALWAKPDRRFIFVGEIHGTREQPAIFADLVCAAAASKRPIVVVIEHDVSEQPALDGFMASSGDARAVRALLSHPWWSEVVDGRESEAYLALIERLRSLKVRLVAMDAEQEDRDHGMAIRILAAGYGLKNPLTLIYAGNSHAAKIPHRPQSPRGAASYLPENETVSLLVTDEGGTAWNCQQQKCGANPDGATTDKPRGITFGPAWLPGYDGELSTGAPSAASPPAVNQKK